MKGRLHTMTLIPVPRDITEGAGSFALPDPLRVAGGGSAAEFLAERLSIAAGIRVETLEGSAEGSGAEVRFTHADDLADEGYRLTVTPSGIEIAAGGDRGRVWAVSTLLQLLPPHVWGQGPTDPALLVVPEVRIEDEPAYGWRGSHIDVARHFLPLDGLYQHLEMMVMHKLNVLHLHLTDDQGWRVPISAYPKLTEVGGFRPGTLPGHQGLPDENGSDDKSRHDGRTHGGFYTREEIDDLNARARALGILVVPEIDMPGHMESVVAAYPELGCTHVEHPRTCWGVSEHVLALTDEGVAFCKAVLDEVADMFPGAPIHIGGDECPGKEWMQHEASRATMERIGASTAAEAQAWFEKEILDHLVGTGRRVIAWDEVLEGDVPKDITVMVWRDAKAINEAATAGFDVIAAPAEFTYFDHAQHKQPHHPLVIGGDLPLAKVAGFSDVLNGVAEEHRHHLLGGQFQLWTEYVHDWSKAQYQLWPRGCSVAQQLWAGNVGPAQSHEGLGDHLVRLTFAGVNWCREQ